MPVTRHFIAAPKAECPLPILCTSQTHGARNQNTEWADDVRNLRRITPQPEHRTGRQNRCQTGGCVLPGNNCEAAANTKPKSDEARHITPAINGARNERPATEGSEFNGLVICWHVAAPEYRKPLAPRYPRCNPSQG